MRNVIDGEADLLQGFEFNIAAKLDSTLNAPFTGTIDRVTGALTVDVPSLVPADSIEAPGGATHFRIISAGTEVDFEKGVYVTGTDRTAEMALDTTPTAAISHAHAVTAGSVHPLFILLGIEFFQEVNGAMYPLKNGAFNALSIISVSGL